VDLELWVIGCRDETKTSSPLDGKVLKLGYFSQEKFPALENLLAFPKWDWVWVWTIRYSYYEHPNLSPDFVLHLNNPSFPPLSIVTIVPTYLYTNHIHY